MKRSDRSQQNDHWQRGEYRREETIVKRVIYLEPRIHRRTGPTAFSIQARYRALAPLNFNTRNSGVSYGCCDVMSFSRASSRVDVVLKMISNSLPRSIFSCHQ